MVLASPVRIPSDRFFRVRYLLISVVVSEMVKSALAIANKGSEVKGTVGKIHKCVIEIVNKGLLKSL